MNRSIWLAIVVLFLNLTPLRAHEGHGSTPGDVAAPHGGVMQMTQNLYLELVGMPNGIKLYPFTHELKPVGLKDLSIRGTATFPKQKTGVPVQFSQEAEAFVAKIDSKGAHRYTLDLNLKYNGKEEAAKIQIEPQE